MRLYPRIFDALNRSGVRYVVVGGLAVVLHGHPRLTVDADIVVDLEPQNALAAIDALLALGFNARIPVDPHEFASAEARASWIREKNLVVFSLSDPSQPFLAVDLFVEPPIPYHDLAVGARPCKVDEVPIMVCSVEDLIRMKELSGRPEDLADIEALRHHEPQR